MNAHQRRIARRSAGTKPKVSVLGVCHDCETHAVCRWQRRCAATQRVLQITYLRWAVAAAAARDVR